MLRPLHVEFPGAVYHVMARGNERREIFRDDHDRHRFLEAVGDTATGAAWRMWCGDWKQPRNATLNCANAWPHSARS